MYSRRFALGWHGNSVEGKRQTECRERESGGELPRRPTGKSNRPARRREPMAPEDNFAARVALPLKEREKVARQLAHLLRDHLFEADQVVELRALGVKRGRGRPHV